MALTGAKSIDEAFEKLRRRVGEIVITDGKKGCWVGNQKDEFKISGRPVSAVDTVGAGDAFAGAYLFGRHQKWPMDQAARFANLIASKVVTKWGPRLNDSEVHRYYQDFCSSEEIK